MQFSKALQHTILWKVLNTILTFCINLLMVRILGAETSGPFFYGIAVLSFCTLLLSWSLEAGITYYGSQRKVNMNGALYWVFPLLILQAGVSWFVIGHFFSSINKQLTTVYIVSNLSIVYFSSFFFATKKFVQVNVTLVISNLALLIFFTYYYLYKFPGVQFFSMARSPAVTIYIYGFAVQALALLLVFFSIPRADKGSAITMPVAKNIFRYSSIAFAGNVLFFLVTRADYYFVEKYCSPVALSNYVQVSKLGQLLVLLPSMMATVVFPYSASKGIKDYLPNVQAICRIISFLFFVMAVLVIVSGYWLFPYLFGKGFSTMYPAMICYLAGFFSLSITTVLAAYLAGNAMLQQNLLASVIALVVVLAGDLLFIPRWGINAAASVSSAAYLLCMLYLLRVCCSKAGCNATDFFRLRKEDIAAAIKSLQK